MKTDFHSHVLPFLDDGATDYENGAELIKAISSWGFERIYCTPHIKSDYRNTPETIRPVYERMLEVLDQMSIKVDLCMSAEYRLVPETWPDILKNNHLLPIDDRYILMEFPISHRDEMKDIDPMEEFHKVMSLGLTPLLPHPERYFYLSEEEIDGFVEAGVKLQCNYGSFAGLYGEKAKMNAERLSAKGYITEYATDMHNKHYVEVIGAWFNNDR